MRETIVVVKPFISPQFIKHGILNTIANIYTKKVITYIIHTFIFNEMRLQYNVSIGCSTIWRKYGVIIGKIRMFISVAMEMEKLYRLVK